MAGGEGLCGMRECMTACVCDVGWDNRYVDVGSTCGSRSWV